MATATLCPSRPPLQLPRSLDPTKSPQSRPRSLQTASPTDRSPPMNKPISPLRQRRIDDMTMRNLSPSTQETYIRAVAQFSTFHWRSPDKLGVEHLREYHLHLVSRGLSANSICVKMSALRFFYRTTL